MNFAILWISLLTAFPAATQGAVQARVYDLKGPRAAEALYSYSLVKSREGTVEQWTAHIKDAQNKEYASENTWLKEGKLVRYSLRQPQIGEEAEVRKIPKGVLFRYFKEGKWKEDWEETSETVITGPQIVDTILRSWDHLLARKPLTVRFAVPDRLETFRFKFEVVSASADSTVIRFVPANFFIRQLVTPVVLTFDGVKTLLSMTGPTFLKKRNGEKWDDLVAEVRFDSVR
jgi:hypothetical protein